MENNGSIILSVLPATNVRGIQTLDVVRSFFGEEMLQKPGRAAESGWTCCWYS